MQQELKEAFRLYDKEGWSRELIMRQNGSKPIHNIPEFASPIHPKI